LRSEYREDAELTQKLLKTIESLTQQVAEKFDLDASGDVIGLPLRLSKKVAQKTAIK